MLLYNIGDVVTVIGEVMVGWTAIAVHHRVRHEHKIDKKTFHLMKLEHQLGKLGIVMIVVGLLIRLAAE